MQIQKRFLRYLYYRVHGVYPHYLSCPVSTTDLLKEFNCRPLFQRRFIADQIFLFKILNNKIDCPYLLRGLSFHIPGKCTRSKIMFNKKKCRVNIYKTSPSQRLMYGYNNVCSELDPFSISLKCYKNSILKLIA